MYASFRLFFQKNGTLRGPKCTFCQQNSFLLTLLSLTDDRLSSTLTEQAQDNSFPLLVELADVFEMGIFCGLVEGEAEVSSQHKGVAIAKVDDFPFVVFRPAAEEAQLDVAEDGDDVVDVVGVKVVVAVSVVGMIGLSFGVDDNDTARVAHGSSVGEGKGHDVEVGVGEVVVVVDFHIWWFGCLGLWVDFDVTAARGAVADDAYLRVDARHGLGVADDAHLLAL